MNGYELADLLEEDMEEGFGLGFLNDAVNMLRQQADRIKQLELQLFKATNRAIANRKKAGKLKKEKIRAYDNGYEDGQKSLQNQADRIAELEKDLEGCEYFLKAQTKPLSDLDPLFYYNRGFNDALRKMIDTKPLSDEEIESIAKPYCDLQNWVVDKHGFAKAIEERHGIK